MKMRFRLTALLLAVMTLLTTATPALATTLDLSTYQQMLDRSAGGSEPIINEGGQVYTMDNTAAPAASGYDSTTTVQLAASAAGSETEQSVTLPYYGKVVLASAIGNGQWQVQVGDQWVNMHGETASTLEVTLAKVQSLFEMNDCAKLRHVAADGSAISNVASIELSYNEQASVAPLLQATVRNAVAPLAEGEEDIPGLYTVEIAYVFANGQPAATSYTATIAEGSELTTSVIQLPKVVGYLATCAHTEDDGVTFVQPTDTTDGSIQLKLKNVTEHKMFTVTYVPTFVDFKVEHYLMGMDSDKSNAEHQEGADQTYSNKKTGEAVGAELAHTYEGFRALWYDDTTPVAADGSTVIKIYYERKWYLMLFDLDGGNGVEPIYAQYGASIGDVGAPTKAGYTFDGWAATKDGEVDKDLPPKTMPCLDESEGRVTYYAKWTANDTAKVTVVFCGENADDEEYSYLQNYTKEINLKPGTTIQYDGTGMLTCGVHSHDANCYKLICTQVPHQHNNCTLACTHSHTTDCYASGNGLTTTEQPTQTLTDQGNGIYTYSYYGTTYYYVKIGEQWYCGQNRRGYASPMTRITFSCNHTTHDDSCYTCSLTANNHRHTDYTGICYELDCDKATHTHNNSCYTNLTGITETTRWKFVKSDTTTVAADGSTVINVYYDRVEYSVQFYENQSCSAEYTSLKITAKWGENILDKWPTYNGSSSWYVKDKLTTWQNSIQVMPVGGAKFWGPKSGSSKYTATYYVEILDGEEYAERGSDGRYYKVHHTDTSNSSGNVTDEERYGIDGFTINNSISTANGTSYGGSKFYYTRNSYKLTFNDQYNDVKNETVKFEAPLSTYKDYVPEVPSAAYEPGSMEFGGWYQNPQCTGEEYRLEEHKMPSNDIILYAKWVPVTRNVIIYASEADMNATPPKKLVDTFTVLHGSYAEVSTRTDTPEQEKFPSKEYMENLNNMSFVGWFYKETVDGKEVEKAFDPDNMPVTKDLDIYAKWSYNDPIAFKVYYRLADENGNAKLDENGQYIEVAEPFESKALYGDTITVEAKTGDELKPEYRSGYFPYPPSHSVKLEAVENETVEYVFLYTAADVVPYRVMYIRVDENGEPLADETGRCVLGEKTVGDNRDVVVTETYKRFDGYMPDAYQKRLIVTSQGTTEDNDNYKTDAELGENIIFFYYKEDKTHAYWTVEHFLEPIGGVTEENDWQSYGLPTTQTGEIGQEQTAVALDNLSGFTFQLALTELDVYPEDATNKNPLKPNQLTYTLPSGGMDFRLYYTRNEYPVKVQYLEQDTMNPLADPELYCADGTNVSRFDYQSQVQVKNNKVIHGYELVGADTQTLQSVAVDGSTIDTIEKNIITFYYKESEVTITYQVVGPEGCGTVALNAEGATGAETVSEIVKALTGEAVGATATPKDNTYKFVGWYTDAECTIPVNRQSIPDGTLSGENNESFVPAKEPEDTSVQPPKPAAYETATFYAKFKYNITTLTITKKGVEAADPNASFVFHVEGKDVDLDVVIKGNGSVTINGLTVGKTYTVTETAGNWRYTPDVKSKKITLEVSGNEVTFTNKRDHDNWLDGDCYIENVFKGVSNQ